MLSFQILDVLSWAHLISYRAPSIEKIIAIMSQALSGI